MDAFPTTRVLAADGLPWKLCFLQLAIAQMGCPAGIGGHGLCRAWAIQVFCDLQKRPEPVSDPGFCVR